MKERIARALGCLILAVAVAACAGGLSGYSKTGVSDQQKGTDYYECQRDSSVLVRRAKGMEEYVLDTDKLNACMRARGYEVQDRHLGVAKPVAHATGRRTEANNRSNRH